MKPKSESLFHFTKSIDVLKKILKDGIQPRFCLEDIEWLDGPEGHSAYAMSCFCDIPLARVSEHTDFYGKYGLGLTKEWGVNNNLNPVIYITKNGIVREHVKYLGNFDIVNNPKINSEYIHHKVSLIKLVKPLSGKMIINGKTVVKEFYQENEWRYLPNNNSIIIGSQFEKEKDAENEKAKAYSLKIEPNDIKYIFVNSDDEIPSLIDFINNNLGGYPLNDVKILQSRIISLSTIESDL